MDIVKLIIDALKFIFPAYCANAIPVLTGGGSPLDLGRNFIDGKPIFGKNKTFRGFFFGFVIGTAVGFLESILFGYSPFFGPIIALGALFGDLTGAFLKRRLGIAPGGLLPVIDQIDFALGAFLFALPISPPFISLELIVIVVIITLPVHLLTNYTAHKLRLKSRPW